MDLAGLSTSLLAQDGEKHSAVALGVLVVLPLILSFLLFRYAKSRVAHGAPRWQLWLSLVPLLFGVYLAIQPLTDILKPSYRKFYFISPRSEILHYATFVTPCVAVLLVVGLILYMNHREKMER